MSRTATAPRADAREEALVRLGAAFKGVTAATRGLRGRETHRPGELSFAQFHLLFHLAEQGQLSIGQLATAAELVPATATQMLDGLERIGLVERERSQEDRRIVTCALTPHGTKMVAERRAELERHWHEALAAFSAAELETAADVLERLRTMLDGFGR
ncbi:MAG TPA: MarR family transcriptional regulator [Gaiellaceae bacterium]|nr:MarR family transcriptional regulator [Gaiellaceae bacterium]